MKAETLRGRIEALERACGRLEEQIKSKSFDLELHIARIRNMSSRFGTMAEREMLADPELPKLLTRAINLMPEEIPCQNP